MQNAANMISPVVNSTISGLANNAGDMIANNSFNPQALAQNASRDASGAIANQMPQNSPVGAGLNAYYQGASPAHAGFTAARTYASQAQNPYLAQAGNAGIDAMQNYYNTFNS
jgi:hypothetical protein